VGGGVGGVLDALHRRLADGVEGRAAAGVLDGVRLQDGLVGGRRRHAAALSNERHPPCEQPGTAAQATSTTS
jgi:hypothetical protein